MSVYEVFAGPSQHDLSGDADLCIFFESYGRLLLVAVVEDDRYACFGYSCLSALVDEILTVPCQSYAPVWDGMKGIPGDSARGQLSYS